MLLPKSKYGWRDCTQDDGTLRVGYVRPDLGRVTLCMTDGVIAWVQNQTIGQDYIVHLEAFEEYKQPVERKVTRASIIKQHHAKLMAWLEQDDEL